MTSEHELRRIVTEEARLTAGAFDDLCGRHPNLTGADWDRFYDLLRAWPVLDLPEPTDRSIPEWEMPNNEHHAVSVSRYGTVRIWGDTSGYEPAEARALAAALLSAAAWAEQQ